MVNRNIVMEKSHSHASGLLIKLFGNTKKKDFEMGGTQNNDGHYSTIRILFETAAVGIGAAATIATVATHSNSAALLMGVALSAAYMLKPRSPRP